MVNFIDGWKNGAQFGEILKFCLLHNLEPAHEGGSAVWMFFRELNQQGGATRRGHRWSYLAKVFCLDGRRLDHGGSPLRRLVRVFAVVGDPSVRTVTILR